MTNKYAGICYVCGKEVGPLSGSFQRDKKNHRWVVKHVYCKGFAPKRDPLPKP